MYTGIIRPFVTYSSECWVIKTNTNSKIATIDEDATGVGILLEYQGWNTWGLNKKVCIRMRAFRHVNKTRGEQRRSQRQGHRSQ